MSNLKHRDLAINQVLDTELRPTLCVAYGVFGLPGKTSDWQKSVTLDPGQADPAFTLVNRTKLKPVVLDSLSKHGASRDPAMTKLLHMAMQASCPNDVDVCHGEAQPSSSNHSFALQQSSYSTLYGVSLLIYKKADDGHAKEIQRMRVREQLTEVDELTSHWIPYVLCLISEYPLFNLLGTYIRAMWLHWMPSSSLYNVQEVDKILSFPVPKWGNLIRINMEQYALTYRFPMNSTRFQNFDMWPLFACLSVHKIVAVLEAMLSCRGRIILSTSHPAMLNIAAESLRYACRDFGWTGLYVPVSHWSSVKTLVEDKGPYILGITQECRTLFRTPIDGILVDLDRGTLETCSPPSVFTKTSSREKFIRNLTEAVGSIKSWGIPIHLRSAYVGDRLTLEGQVIDMETRVDIVSDPAWWSQDAILAACDHVCNKLRKNRGIKKLTSGTKKTPAMTRISARALQNIEHDNAINSRETHEAWANYCLLEARMSSENMKLTQRNEFLVEELTKWGLQFEKFRHIAQHLTKQSLELKAKMNNYRAENGRLNSLISSFADERRDLTLARDAAMKGHEDLAQDKALLLEQLRLLEKENSILLQQRDTIESVLKSLRRLIQTQPQAVVKVFEKQGVAEKHRLGSERLRAVQQPCLLSSPRTLSRTSRHSAPDNDRLEIKLHTAAKNISDVKATSIVGNKTTEVDETCEIGGKGQDSLCQAADSDPEDTLIREQTENLTKLFDQITAECLATIDQIDAEDEIQSSAAIVA